MLRLLPANRSVGPCGPVAAEVDAGATWLGRGALRPVTKRCRVGERRQCQPSGDDSELGPGATEPLRAQTRGESSAEPQTGGRTRPNVGIVTQPGCRPM